MRILFDHGAPTRIAGALAGHAVTQAIDRGWNRISNGELLKLAEEAGFELLLTTDKNLFYQAIRLGAMCAPILTVLPPP